MVLSSSMHRSALAVIGVVAALLTAGTAATASAAPAPTSSSPTSSPPASSPPAKASTSKKGAPTITSVTKQLTALGNRNETLTEQYNLAGLDVQLKQKQAAAAAVTASRSAATYVGARNQVKLSLQAQYQEGTFRQTTALLTSTSGQNYLDKSTALQQISSRRAGMAGEMRTARAAAVKASATAAKLLAAATAKRDALARQRTSLAAQQVTYRKLLDELNAQQQRAFLQVPNKGVTDKQVAAVKKTLAVATKKAATKSATKKSITIKSATKNSATKNPVTTTTSGTAKKSAATKAPVTTTKKAATAGSAPAPSTAAAIAVRYALAQLGKPYVYATSGPRTFDCSGLTAAAWRAAGRNIPHQSRLQSLLGHRVARSDLQPGDLVFYYSPIHHVAIYIGHGLVVSAPQTGDVVKIVPVGHAGTYNMAVRL